MSESKTNLIMAHHISDMVLIAKKGITDRYIGMSTLEHIEGPIDRNGPVVHHLRSAEYTLRQLADAIKERRRLLTVSDREDAA